MKLIFTLTFLLISILAYSQYGLGVKSGLSVSNQYYTKGSDKGVNDYLPSYYIGIEFEFFRYKAWKSEKQNKWGYPKKTQ